MRKIGLCLLLVLLCACQSDWQETENTIYDEMVEKYDVVEYSLMKTFDFKKQQPSSKAILIKTLYEDIQY